MSTWITVWQGNNDPRYAVKYDTDKVSANDGDVCLSFVTYDYLKGIEHPYCLDIGADQCWWSIFCSEHFPGCRVDAFEPKGVSEEIVKHYPQIQVHSYAVSDISGALPFTLQGSDSHSREPSVSTVPCQPVSPFLQKKVDFIKLDTEGHELIILKTMLPFLSTIGAIVFECSMVWYGEHLGKALSQAMEIFTELRRTHPYVYMLSRRGEPTLYNLSDEETLLETLSLCYMHREQFDCLVVKEPFELKTQYIL